MNKDITLEILKEDKDKINNEIMQLQRMIYRLNDYIYHIQKIFNKGK